MLSNLKVKSLIGLVLAIVAFFSFDTTYAQNTISTGVPFLLIGPNSRMSGMGETGTGQATKICNQLIVAANSTLIAEAVALADQAGVDTRLLAPALAGGFADSKPFQILAPRMATHTFEPVQWKVQTLSKDLNNALKLAQSFNLKIPVAQKALLQLQAHQENGFADNDLATIIQYIEQ